MSEQHSTITVDSEILPVPIEKRTLSLPGNFAIWFAANMVTTTMLTGMLLVPGLSFATAMQAIILGSVIGSIPLILIAIMGQKTGLVSMVVTRGTFGTKGAIVPSMANVTILIFWSWAQAALGGLALNHGVMTLTGWDAPTFWIVFCQALVVLVTLYAIKGIALYEKIAMALIVAIMGAVIYKAITVTGLNNILSIEAVAEEGMTRMIAFDIVVGMALSWTALGADYGRNCKSLAGSIIGTGGGYLLGTIISMGTGALMIAMILAAGLTTNYEPSIVFDQIGFGIAGSIVIFMSVVAANVLCIYSATISFLSTFPKANYTKAALVIGLICILGAVFSDILTQFLSFINLIAVVFMPIFAIMIADFFVVQKQKYNIEAIVYPDKDKQYYYTDGYNLKAFGVYAVAAAFSFYFTMINPIPSGASIPTFFLAFLGYILVMKLTTKKN